MRKTSASWPIVVTNTTNDFVISRHACRAGMRWTGARAVSHARCRGRADRPVTVPATRYSCDAVWSEPASWCVPLRDLVQHANRQRRRHRPAGGSVRTSFPHLAGLPCLLVDFMGHVRRITAFAASDAALSRSKLKCPPRAGRTRETALRTHPAPRWLIRWAALRRCPLLFEPRFDAAYARSELDGG